MKAFLDLAVLGKPEALKKFLPSVKSLLPPGAYRDREIEDRIKERSPDSPLRFIRWRRFSDDLIFPIEQIPEAICFREVFLYPGRIVPAPGFPPLLAEFFYRFVKPASDRLGLKYYSTAFEETPPQWAKRRERSAIEIALGWSVARQLLAEGYTSHLLVRDETESEAERQREQQLTARLKPRGRPGSFPVPMPILICWARNDDATLRIQRQGPLGHGTHPEEAAERENCAATITRFFWDRCRHG